MMESEDIVEAVQVDEPNQRNNEPDCTTSNNENTESSDMLNELKVQASKLEDWKQNRQWPRLHQIQQSKIQKIRAPRYTANNKVICWNCAGGAGVGHYSQHCRHEPKQCYACQQFGH